jgi:predicted RNA-binding protein YlxR (DUF448 family)/ribosomal protein L30E
MVERTCIVTRRVGEPDGLLRFVAGPDMTVVPDLKRNLPGRGCWVTADRLHVDEAARKNLFRRSFKAEVTVDRDLGALVDDLMVRALCGALGLARKAGAVALGAAKTDAAIRSGKALFVLHAFEAAEDGVRKLTQARTATVHLGGPDIPAYKLISEAEMGLAMGGTNVIHAAVLAQDAGKAAFRRVVALDRYRGGPSDGRAAVEGAAGNDGAS